MPRLPASFILLTDEICIDNLYLKKKKLNNLKERSINISLYKKKAIQKIFLFVYNMIFLYT